MALQKEDTNLAGAVGSYWKSCQENLDRRTNTMRIQLLLFKDASYAHDLEKAPIKSLTFDASFTSQQLAGDRSALAYAWIKANVEFFSDAEDV